jgi:hypothetical protein
MNASVERVRDALAELIKAALISADDLSLACREAGRAQLAALAADPPDPDSLRMDGAWTLAIQAAETPELAALEGQVNLTLPRTCPFGDPARRGRPARRCRGRVGHPSMGGGPTPRSPLLEIDPAHPVGTTYLCPGGRARRPSAPAHP